VTIIEWKIVVAQFVMFQFPASLTLIPLVRLVHLHICYLLSLSALAVDNETTALVRLLHQA
jgi:hypothetical protein